MKKVIFSLLLVAVFLAIGDLAYAHSGRTTTSNSYGLPGHVDHSTGTWHSHF